MKLVRRRKTRPRPWKLKSDRLRSQTGYLFRITGSSKKISRMHGLTLWKPCLFQYRCECHRIPRYKKEKPSKIKSNRTGLSEGKPLKHPINKNPSTRKILRTFQIKYDGKLSLLAECMLSTFQNKYIYYAIDDILYLLHSNSKERENLLELFYSSMLSLHNDFSINFFDIWIDSIYINDTCKNNRFLINESQKLKQGTYITLKLYYIKRLPIKKPEPIW